MEAFYILIIDIAFFDAPDTPISIQFGRCPKCYDAECRGAIQRFKSWVWAAWLIQNQ